MKKIIKLFMVLAIYAISLIIALIGFGVINIEFITGNNPDKYINNGLSLDDENLSLSNEKQNRFYYNQLSDTAKKIYDKIIKNEEKLKTGTAEIQFTNHEFDDILKKSTGMQTLSEEYQNAVDAVRYDNMDLFYIDFTKTILRTITYTKASSTSFEVYLTKIEGEDNYFVDNITSKQQVDAMLTEIKAIKDALLPQATGSNYQKIYFIHNWLIDNLQYDETQSEPNTRNIYGALLEQKVVCEGYAKTFKYLLDELNIPCIIVSGYAQDSEGNTERHMWNYVQINNVWYTVDVTWDDPIIMGNAKATNAQRYKYFCQGDNINNNHFIENQTTIGCQEWEYPTIYHKEEE